MKKFFDVLILVLIGLLGTVTLFFAASRFNRRYIQAPAEEFREIGIEVILLLISSLLSLGSFIFNYRLYLLHAPKNEEPGILDFEVAEKKHKNNILFWIPNLLFGLAVTVFGLYTLRTQLRVRPLIELPNGVGWHIFSLAMISIGVWIIVRGIKHLRQ